MTKEKQLARISNSINFGLVRNDIKARGDYNKYIADEIIQIVDRIIKDKEANQHGKGLDNLVRLHNHAETHKTWMLLDKLASGEYTQKLGLKVLQELGLA